MTILTPPNEAIALSSVRSSYKAAKHLSDAEKAEKRAKEEAERVRLATEEGKVCFDLFAGRVATLLHGSDKVRSLISTMYPYIILDEFQDTSADQWRVVQALGASSTLIALADPEQRILLQQRGHEGCFDEFVELMCSYFHGRGGATPTKGDMDEAARFRKALAKWNECLAKGQAAPGNSVLQGTYAVHQATAALTFTGDPDADWVAVRGVLDAGACQRLKDVAKDVRNVRLLERGTQLRQGLAQDWREIGGYGNALAITRQSFVQEHFATAHKPESGIMVMNMHKAKGKQFDEVVIFEGWPKRVKNEVVGNPDRIVLGNVHDGAMTQARQNFRVSVTRAKTRTTIMTPRDDVCVLLRAAPA